MTSPALKINRDKLYGFLQDHEMVIQFENLFQQVDEAQDLDIDGIANEAGDALAKANSALYQLTKKIDNSHLVEIGNAIQKGNTALQALKYKLDSDHLVEIGNAIAKSNSNSGRVNWKRKGTLLNPLRARDDVEWDVLRYLDNTTGGTGS